MELFQTGITDALLHQREGKKDLLVVGHAIIRHSRLHPLPVTQGYETYPYPQSTFRAPLVGRSAYLIS